MSAKVLFVDDEPNVLSGYQRNLRNQFEIDIASSGAEGLKLIEEKGPYSVIVSDMSMPGMDGIQFLQAAKESEPDSVRIMLTGNADLSVAMDALHRGSIFQFLVKPCAPESLALALEGAVAQYRLVTAERELLDKTLKGTIRVLIEMLSLADPVLFGKVQNLRKNLRLLARELEASDLWKLELVAMLSQIGLFTLPPQILSKMRSNMTLSEVEAKMVERIPEISHNLLVNIPRLEPVAQAVLYTQKHYDGSGFPGDNVAGAVIPIGARMLKVLTDLAQLEAEGASRAGALAMMQRRPGWYDPKIITAASSSLLNKNRDHLAAKLPCIPIAVRDLRLGDVIGADITASDGTLLISEGHKVTATLLEKIRNFADLTGIKEPVHIVKYPSARERIAAELSRSYLSSDAPPSTNISTPETCRERSLAIVSAAGFTDSASNSGSSGGSSMADDFRDRNVIITGGAGGVGMVATRAWLDTGARVLVGEAHAEALDSLRRDLVGAAAPANNRLGTIAVDLTTQSGAEAMVAEARRFFGALPDTLIHLVGGFAMGPLDAPEAPAQWNKMLALNLQTNFYCYRAILPALKERCGGWIVGMASRAAIEPPAQMAAYAASKSALIALTRSLSAEVRDQDIHVNVILASTIDTPANRAAMGEKNASKWVRGEDIAAATLYLCSERAHAVHGATLEVYGQV